MTYEVEIRETLSKNVEIEAANKLEALDFIKKKYKECEIVLNSEDFIKVEYFIKLKS